MPTSTFRSGCLLEIHRDRWTRLEEATHNTASRQEFTARGTWDRFSLRAELQTAALGETTPLARDRGRGKSPRAQPSRLRRRPLEGMQPEQTPRPRERFLQKGVDTRAFVLRPLTPAPLHPYSPAAQSRMAPSEAFEPRENALHIRVLEVHPHIGSAVLGERCLNEAVGPW